MAKKPTDTPKLEDQRERERERESKGYAELQSGYVIDYISGEHVRATPEEVQAVQVFARRLVEDYGYPKGNILTRPQYRVRKSPSDEAKSYPVDIAVFQSPKHIEDDLWMVVECKQKNRKVGVAQLKLYMDMSAAVVGVWFNGDEHEYIRKVLHKDGTRSYEPLPNIPRYGQRIEDIGLYKRKDLRKPSNLKAVFKDIRNHLAGMAVAITRDEPLAQEIINILFCKIYDEQDTEPDEMVSFRAGVGEPANTVRRRILGLFAHVKEEVFGDVFDQGDTIKLDADSLLYVVGELQNYAVTEADRDAIGDAFELFIGPALRGAEGQFFTPRNVVQMVVDALDPQPGDKIVDPACGSGGFLICAIGRVWDRLRSEGKRKNWTERQLTKREVEVATECFRGVDKDSFLAKVCKAYMALVGDGRGGVFCTNSLLPATEWSEAVRDKIKLGAFDVVMTNPPFGAKIIVKGANILSQFDLAYQWKLDKETDDFTKTTVLPDERPPQILFLERCLQLLKKGGKLGIVLPESILGNPSYEHVIAYMLERCRIRMIATMPEALFKTSGKGGTHTKVCVIVLEKQFAADYDIFMAEAKWCGHDSRGNPTIQKTETGNVLLDDVPTIAERFKLFAAGKPFRPDHLGFSLSTSKIQNRILVPRYYNPELDRDLRALRKTHDLVLIGKMVEDKALSITTGVEIGKMAYGTGKIPFIRTSDLSNWEIKADFKHGVSKEIYDEFTRKADVEAGDILLVRDGTYLIGTTAIVTKSDVPMLFQSHIFRIRVLKEQTLSPWLLLACLNAPIVKRQVRSKQFTQDIIDTLGKRVLEIYLPIPKDEALRKRLADETKRVIEKRVELRNRVKEIALEVSGESSSDADLDELDAL
jgi:type I restriction enzyme M protein